MRKSEDMGFKLYHGTAKPFARFDIKHAGSGAGYNNQGRGIYLTNDIFLAMFFAREAATNKGIAKIEKGRYIRKPGAVLEVKLKKGLAVLDLDNDRIRPGTGFNILRDSGLRKDTLASFSVDELEDPRFVLNCIRYGSKRANSSDLFRKYGIDAVIFNEPSPVEGILTGPNPRTVVVFNSSDVIIRRIVFCTSELECSKLPMVSSGY